MRKLQLSFGLTVLFLLVGCGGKGPAGIDGGPGEAKTDAGQPPPQYVVAGSNTTPEGTTSYVAIVDSLDAGTTIDYTKVLEVPGQAGIVGPEKGGYFLVGSDAEAALTRYDVSATGFTQGAKLSFAAFGVRAGAASPQRAAFVSGTRMFYLSRFTPDLFEIDPSQMTITTRLSLSELTPTAVGAPSGFSEINNGMIIRDGKLFIFCEHWNLMTSASFPVARVAVVDLATNAITYTTDTRCGGLVWMAQGPDGALYGSTLLSAFNVIRRPATPGACVLRIPKDSTVLDTGYKVEMKDSFSGAMSATVFFDDQLSPWTFTLPVAEIPSAVMTQGVRGFYATSAFRWTKLTADMKPVAQAAPVQTGLIVATWTMGGTVYVPTLTKTPFNGNSVDSTKLYRFVGGQPIEMITFRGVSYGAVQVH